MNTFIMSRKEKEYFGYSAYGIQYQQKPIQFWHRRKLKYEDIQKTDSQEKR